MSLRPRFLAHPVVWINFDDFWQSVTEKARNFPHHTNRAFALPGRKLVFVHKMANSAHKTEELRRENHILLHARHLLRHGRHRYRLCCRRTRTTCCVTPVMLCTKLDAQCDKLWTVVDRTKASFTADELNWTICPSDRQVICLCDVVIICCTRIFCITPICDSVWRSENIM